MRAFRKFFISITKITEYPYVPDFLPSKISWLGITQLPYTGIHMKTFRSKSDDTNVTSKRIIYVALISWTDYYTHEEKSSLHRGNTCSLTFNQQHCRIKSPTTENAETFIIRTESYYIYGNLLEGDRKQIYNNHHFIKASKPFLHKQLSLNRT